MTPNFDIDYVMNRIRDACEHPILILPACKQNRSDSYGVPLYLAPPGASVVAVGRHSHLPFSLVAYISETGEIVVGITGPASICSSVSVRLWADNTTPNEFQSAEFQTVEDRAIATLAMGKWTEGPVSGFAVIYMAPISANNLPEPGPAFGAESDLRERQRPIPEKVL